MSTLHQSTLSHKEQPVPVSFRFVRVRVPEHVHEALRRLAFENRLSYQDILLEALEARLKKGAR
jgi:predicted DNA binding CopG/RHH family protein